MSKEGNYPLNHIASVLKRSTRADCKSAGISLRRFESLPAHKSATSETKVSEVLLFVAPGGIRRTVLGFPSRAKTVGVARV